MQRDERLRRQWVGQVTWEAAKRQGMKVNASLLPSMHVPWRGGRDRRGMTRRGLGFLIHQSVSNRINMRRPKMTSIFPSA